MSDRAPDVRLAATARRNAKARQRDVDAAARDQAAAVRDSVMATHDILGARYPEQSAAYRLCANQDRIAAARDRVQAARDRMQAIADVEALTRQLTRAETNLQTGTGSPGPGFAEFAHEVERCRRENGELSVAYVDVVGLKLVNDAQGRSAGDAMLSEVVSHIRVTLRPDDLIIRTGGDAFLCVMLNRSEADARERLSQVAGVLAGTSPPVAIRTGFAHLTGAETANDLITRAGRELTDHRRYVRLSEAGEPAA